MLPRDIRRSVGRQAAHVLRTGSRFRSFDQIRQRHFWSTFLFVPDANGYIATTDAANLFTTPAGQVGQGFAAALTERETNWQSARRVPDNQNFEMTELGVTSALVPSSLGGGHANEDTNQPGSLLTAFLQNTTVDITYLTNSVPLGMASDFAQAAGPMMGIYQPFMDENLFPFGVPPAADPKVLTRYSTNGFAAPGLRRRFKIPILLQHGETFSFTFKVPRSYFVGVGNAVYARLDFWATESFVEKS